MCWLACLAVYVRHVFVKLYYCCKQGISKGTVEVCWDYRGSLNCSSGLVWELSLLTERRY